MCENSWIFWISVVNFIEQQVAVMLSSLVHGVWNKLCGEPNWSSCSQKAVSLDTFEQEAALQSSEEHQTESDITAPTCHSRDLLIKGVAEK